MHQIYGLNTIQNMKGKAINATNAVKFFSPSFLLLAIVVTPGDSRGITKYHSNQYVRCSRKQWQMDELVDVLCPSGAYEIVFWWFLDLSQFASN